jgi:hypothetical protein
MRGIDTLDNFLNCKHDKL